MLCTPTGDDIYCQLSTVNCQLSTVNCQLSIVNCQLSIFIYDLYGRKQDEIIIPKGHEQIRVDVSGYPAGVGHGLSASVLQCFSACPENSVACPENRGLHG